MDSDSKFWLYLWLIVSLTIGFIASALAYSHKCEMDFQKEAVKAGYIQKREGGWSTPLWVKE